MKKVITYGTFDLLHYGHVRLLERAKALGDYLIVGVTSDDYDKSRGKINVQQSLMERIDAVKATGIADEVIVEEYEGQKIDDICKYGIDIFTVGSDWVGKFDYLNKYCEVHYLDRTEGVSSSEIRSEKRKIRIGLVGDTANAVKFLRESQYVNGIEIIGVCANGIDTTSFNNIRLYDDEEYDKLVDLADALYISSLPEKHYDHIRNALLKGKHILCESPIALSRSQYDELVTLANEKHVVLMDAIKTAYSTAFIRLVRLVQSGRIGKIVSVDATCTSLKDINTRSSNYCDKWNSLCDWGPTAMLPVFQLLGTDYIKKNICSIFAPDNVNFDLYTKIDFIYKNATASIKVAKGAKSEGELVITGTEGYIYVPAPWWKTDYFEIRYEDLTENKRYFYQLDGEGIRYEEVAFLRAIQMGYVSNEISTDISRAICGIAEAFYKKEDFTEISP